MRERGWALVAVIVVTGVLNFFQEYQAPRAVAAFREPFSREITGFSPCGALRGPVDVAARR